MEFINNRFLRFPNVKTFEFIPVPTADHCALTETLINKAKSKNIFFIIKSFGLIRKNAEVVAIVWFPPDQMFLFSEIRTAKNIITLH